MAKAKIRGLDCAAPADQMIRLVLRAHVNTMCRHRDPALKWRDPEGVHDMRVLSRRLRSALNDFKPYFRKGTLPRPKLRALADALGNVRDEDVALMALHELKSHAKGAAAEGITLLIDERKQRRTSARTDLKTAIDEPSIEGFRKDFIAKLQAMTIGTPIRSVDPAAAQIVIPFGELGTLIIKARLKEFVAAASFLFQPYKVKQLHELRILAKRLRYSMELFARCGDKELASMAKEVAHMQTALGELHDCDVWISDLGTRLRRLSRKTATELNDEKLRAGAMWLLKHFAAERMDHYCEALARWEQWQSTGFLEKVGKHLDGDSSAELAESRAA
jgi:CHAD domain-containing protein